MRYIDQLEKLAKELEATPAERRGMQKLIKATQAGVKEGVGATLASKEVLSPEALGMVQSLVAQVEALADSIVANGDQIAHKMAEYLPPALEDLDMRKRVMEEARERFLKAAIERRYEDALREFNGDIVEAVMKGQLGIPGGEVYNWMAAAAIVVAATLAHSVYTSYASGRLGKIYTDPRWNELSIEDRLGAKIKRAERFR